MAHGEVEDEVEIEKLLKQTGSIYKLVILAATRAKELAEGAPPLVKSKSRKITSVVLEEISQGKVFYKPEEPVAGSGKKGRASKSKEEKKKRTS